MTLDWLWVQANLTAGTNILGLVGQHAMLAFIPVVAAFVLSIPLGTLLARIGTVGGTVRALLGLISAIPALALFVTVPLGLGTRIVDPLNVVVALTVYSTARLTRRVGDGLRLVPSEVRQSATALGFGRVRCWLRVELPLAMPSVFRGLRVVTVSNVVLVSVAALVGRGALGHLFTTGFTDRFATPVIVGLVLGLVLALVADLIVVVIRRSALPWARRGRPV